MALIDDSFAALTDLRAALESGDDVGCHVFIYAPRTRQRRDEWYRVAMDGALAERFIDGSRQALLDVEARATDGELTEFTFDAMATGSVGVIATDDVPGIAEWLGAVPADDWPTRFDGDENVLEKARYYVNRVNFPDGRILRTFRGRRGLNVIVRTRGVAAVFRRDTREMVPVEGAVISFDQEMDFFEWDGFLYISNLTAFESLTNVREITAQKAEEAVDVLAGRFQLGDAEVLKAEIGKRTRLAKKLAASLQHGLFGDIDFDNLAERARFKNMNVRCEVDGQECRIIFDPHNRDEVEDFVNLVSDFFLNSPVTGREWEAVVKRPARERRPAAG